ncbi:MAG: acyl-CoA/acyl-ACP dehydrogenase [Gemmataceae bacterium]|jgi:alkylation response protein AidB-like acyl-CoA dehydrogenase|nr:acyl-CoA/acyl-ACP dehydrogenase [Gemmataceae bacterium]
MSVDIVSLAEKVATETIRRYASEVDTDGRWPAESIDALKQSKLLGLVVPTEFGGMGAGPSVFAKVTRIIAQECASTGMIFLMHICGTRVIIDAPAFPRRNEILQRIASGNHLTTLAFSEKGSRSHFWAPVSQAVPQGDKQSVSAQKSWVTSAGHADSYVVSTQAVNAKEGTTSNLFYVEKTQEGVSVTSLWNGLGLRGNASAPMKLENVFLGVDELLSPEGGGFGSMMSSVLPWFQLGNASVSLGICAAAIESTRTHLLNSKLEHLGQNLASLPNLRGRLARMKILYDTHLAFIEQVAHKMETNAPDVMLAVLESKAAVSEMALELTDLAMRTCGGAAFSKHLTVERNFRDARAAWVMAPTTDVLQDFIGKALLDMPLF